MTRHESKSKFIALEVLRVTTRHNLGIWCALTDAERFSLTIQQAASFDRIKQIQFSIPAKCFKKDSIGIDKRRYKRYLRKSKGLIVKVNIEAQSSNQAMRDGGLG